MANIQIEEVNCQVRKSIPGENENILTDFTINADNVRNIDIYYRDDKECPFARGNWIVDIHFNDELACIKLPKEITKEQIMHYMKPLLMKT